MAEGARRRPTSRGGIAPSHPAHHAVDGTCEVEPLAGPPSSGAVRRDVARQRSVGAARRRGFDRSSVGGAAHLQHALDQLDPEPGVVGGVVVPPAEVGQVVELGGDDGGVDVHDHLRPLRRRPCIGNLVRQARLADGHERIGPALLDGGVLRGGLRSVLERCVECPHDGCVLLRGEPGTEDAEAILLGEHHATLGLELGGRRGGDDGRRHDPVELRGGRRPSEFDELLLVVLVGDPRQGPHLEVRQLAALEGLRRRRERLERAGDAHLLVGRRPPDAALPRQPLGAGAGAPRLPRLPAVELGDHEEELAGARSESGGQPGDLGLQPFGAQFGSGQVPHRVGRVDPGAAGRPPLSDAGTNPGRQPAPRPRRRRSRRTPITGPPAEAGRGDRTVNPVPRDRPDQPDSRHPDRPPGDRPTLAGPRRRDHSTPCSSRSSPRPLLTSSPDAASAPTPPARCSSQRATTPTASTPKPRSPPSAAPAPKTPPRASNDDDTASTVAATVRPTPPSGASCSSG